MMLREEGTDVVLNMERTVVAGIEDGKVKCCYDDGVSKLDVAKTLSSAVAMILSKLDEEDAEYFKSMIEKIESNYREKYSHINIETKI